MAIIRTPWRVAPAFNEIVVTDNANTSLQVTGVAPTPTESVTLRRVKSNGAAQFDLKGFVSKLFYDGRQTIATSLAPWAFRDGRLLASYKIGNSAEVYYALNAVRQTGEKTHLTATVAPVVLTDRAKLTDKEVRIPCYEGYPVGASFMYRDYYDPKITIEAFAYEIQTPTPYFLYALNITESKSVLIEWGDGTTEHYLSEDGMHHLSHVYQLALNYAVAIWVLPGARFWGVQPVTDLSSDNIISGMSVMREIYQWSENFIQCTLSGANQLSAIPDGPYPGRLDYVAHMFRGCKELRQPLTPDFFMNAATESITTVEYLFSGTTETFANSITGETMQYLSEARDASYLFYGSSLTTVRVNLFKHLRGLINIKYLFAYTKFTAIPQGLFDGLAEVIVLNHVFLGTQIVAVPAALFDSMAKATNIGFVFASASKLKSVPPRLFDVFANATVTQGIFQNASSFSDFPADLFDNMVRMASAAEMFHNTGLTYIPPKLFARNKLILHFGNCFKVDSTNFPHLTGETPVTDEGYKLWERAGKPGYPATITGTQCFNGQTGLTDYNDIPTDWK